MTTVFLFLLGLAVGSFLNVAILRVNTGLSLRGRSRCFSCLKKLAWNDMIPVISYCSIRGKCRYCGSGISLQYPVVEFISGVIFASSAYFMFGGSMPDVSASVIPLLKYILTVSFFSVLLAISVYDIRHKIIPDQFSAALFGVAALFELVSQMYYFNAGELVSDIITAAATFAFFAGIWYVSRGKFMGFGDAKVAVSIGLFFGSPATVFAIFFAFWIGAIYGIIMLVLRVYNRKSELPFAPFLALGSFLSFILASSEAISLYYKYIMVI